MKRIEIVKVVAGRQCASRDNTQFGVEIITSRFHGLYSLNQQKTTEMHTLI